VFAVVLDIIVLSVSACVRDVLTKKDVTIGRQEVANAVIVDIATGAL
jgi:hypothetical protein